MEKGVYKYDHNTQQAACKTQIDRQVEKKSYTLDKNS